MEKILITGTGRCGTTFIIKLFSFLNYDTGYTKENYENYIYNNCNSGLERDYTEPFSVLKNPSYIENIKMIIEDKNVFIKQVIIPIRDYKLSAISRVNNTCYAGGLWNAIDEYSQIQFFNKIISDYIYFMTKYDINTIFIDFDKMVHDKMYLFNKLKNMLDEKKIDFELFSTAYDDASTSSRPQTCL